MRRWVLWILVVPIVLLLLAGAAVQGVLWWSDLPRSLVEDELAKETGLVVRVGSVTTGWSGRTTIRGLTLSLPLADHPLATVPEAQARHASLIPLILRRPLNLRELELDSPALDLNEDEFGHWNIDRAAELIGIAQAASPPSGSPAGLPRLVVRDGLATLHRPGRGEMKLPLTLTGTPRDLGASWSFEASAGGILTATGLVSRPPTWAHRVEFRLSDPSPLLALWMESPPADLAADGVWSGAAATDGLDGTLDLAAAQGAGLAAKGRVRVRSQAGAVTLGPIGLEVWGPGIPNGAARLESGDLAVSDAGVTARSVVIAWAGVSAAIDGAWDRGRGSGEASAVWSSVPLLLPGDASGTAHASVTIPPVGVRTVALDLRGVGRVASGEWTLDAALRAAGPGWADLRGDLTANALTWTDAEGTIDLAGLALGFVAAEPRFAVTRLTVPGAASASGGASFDRGDGSWSVNLAVSGWEIPRVGAGPLEIVARGSGNGERAEGVTLHVAAGEQSLDVEGSYLPERSPPLLAEATAAIGAWTSEPVQPPGDTAHAAPALSPAAATSPAAAPAVPRIARSAGRWIVAADVRGTLSPVRLSADGAVRGSGLRAGAGLLDPVVCRLIADADGAGASVRTERFRWMEGEWTLAARFDRRDRSLVTRVGCRGLPLNRFADAASIPIDVAGVLNASLRASLPGLDAARTEVSGDWSVTDFATAETSFERGEGRVNTRGGRIELSDIALRRGEGLVGGSVSFNIDTPSLLRVEATSRAWPVAIRGTTIAALIDSRCLLDVDLKTLTARGRAAADADISIGGRPYGTVGVDSEVSGRTVIARSITGTVGGGTLTGSATVPLDDWVRSAGAVEWRGVGLPALVGPWGGVEGLAGAVSGRLTARPADDPRALEPLRFDAEVTPSGGGYRGVPFGGASFTLFASRTRAILDRGRIDAAGGLVRLWGRLSRHGGARSFHARVNFDGISIDDLVRAADPHAPPTPGVVSGRFTVGTELNDFTRSFGGGHLSVSQADLGSVPILSSIYGLLSVGDDDVPRGLGEAHFRLEGKKLEVSRIQYFNRGADAAGRLTILDVTRLADSPISGIISGAARPFKDLGLPFIPQADELFTALQSGSTSIRVGGTLRKRDIRVVPFADVQGTLQEILDGAASE